MTTCVVMVRGVGSIGRDDHRAGPWLVPADQ
jgi:hypothetical protein